MSTRTITFKVFRFTAGRDYEPHYKTYAMEVSHDEVVLDVLNRIKWEHDGGFSYRRSCRHGICGSCAIRVNNKTMIPCKENVFQVADIFGDELIIQPLNEKKAVKDLIIDKSDFWEKYEAVKPWLIAEIDEHPEKENYVDPEYVEALEEADYCIQCGSCYYICSALDVNENYLGPAALAKAFRFTADIRDVAKEERLRGVNELGSGIWDCVKCFECAEACPKGVDPIAKITRLHNQTFEAGVHESNVATRHAYVFKKSIEKYGPLDEAENVRFSEGTLGALKHMGVAFDMLKAGKLPMPGRVHKSKNHDEIKKLVKIASKNKF